jgi:1-deoxy-D-xylulose-5-phosphate synthase
MIKLNEIKNPKFLKEYNTKELIELSSVIRDGLIKVVSTKGGHLSSNLGTVELIIALHKAFDFSMDKLIIDIGHQAYAHKILTGRYQDMLSTLRELDGISGYQRLSESKYDHFEAGHAATSLAAASGFLKAKILNNQDHNIVALIGDGAISSGLSLEALNNLRDIKGKMIIILNDNGMSISKPTGTISNSLNKFRQSNVYISTKYSLKKLLKSNSLTTPIYDLLKKTKDAIKRTLIGKNIFENFDLKYIGPIDGHDFKALNKAFNAAKLADRSIVVHVQTIKGKGFKQAEGDIFGKWHGVDKFDVDNNKDKAIDYKLSWSKAMANIIEEMMAKDGKIITITPAMVEGSKLGSIFNNYPTRAIDVGINEEYALTYASGLYLAGFKPFISVYSTFLQRSYDQIIHDNAKLGNSMLVGVDRAGLVGHDGETHHGIYDVAFLKSIPNSIIAMPSDLEEMRKLVKLGFNNGMFFLRYPRGKVVEKHLIKNQEIKLGQWDYVKQNKESKTTLIVTGPVIHQVIDNFKDLNVNIVYARFYNPIDEKILDSISGNIIVYDIYSTNLGLFNSIATYCALKKLDISLHDFSLKNMFYPHGSIDDLLIRYKLDLKNLQTEVEKIIKHT